MNKLSGYREFTLSNGKKLELKFCNGSTEIFAELMGLTSLKEATEALSGKEVPLLDDNGQPVLDDKGQPLVTREIKIEHMRALRLYTYAAALYAARVQNKPIDFNEWTAAEWIEEVGIDAIMGIEDTPEEPKKNEEQPQPEPATK